MFFKQVINLSLSVINTIHCYKSSIATQHPTFGQLLFKLLTMRLLKFMHILKKLVRFTVKKKSCFYLVFKKVNINYQFLKSI